MLLNRYRQLDRRIQRLPPAAWREGRRLRGRELRHACLAGAHRSAHARLRAHQYPHGRPCRSRRSVQLYTILGADVYLWPTVIALCFAILVIFLNFKGAGAAAKLSSFLTKALLTGMILAMVISFATGSPSNGLPLFSQATEVAGGEGTKATSFFGGIIAVLVMTPFFYAGFDTIPQQAEEASADLDGAKFLLKQLYIAPPWKPSKYSATKSV